MVDSFAETPGHVGYTPSIYKTLRTTFYGLHVLKAAHLTTLLLAAVTSYNANIDIDSPGQDCVLGAAFELHIQIGPMDVRPVLLTARCNVPVPKQRSICARDYKRVHGRSH